MTTTDAPPPPPPVPPFIAPPAPPESSVAPAKPVGPPVSVLSVISFVLIVLTSIAYLTAKTLVPVFDGKTFELQVETLAIIFGILGLLSIVPIAASIVLGHLGARRSQVGKRGRVLGIVGLGIGYLLLALYFNRLIVAGIALATFPHGTNFLENNFFWA